MGFADKLYVRGEWNELVKNDSKDFCCFVFVLRNSKNGIESMGKAGLGRQVVEEIEKLGYEYVNSEIFTIDEGWCWAGSWIHKSRV